MRSGFNYLTRNMKRSQNDTNLLLPQYYYMLDIARYTFPLTLLLIYVYI